MAEESASVADSSQAPAPNHGSSFWNVLLPVLSFIGTGIGLLGFVIFFGGFILWTRFDAAGVPADDAVAQVPRNDLVVTGASFLVPALLAAVVAVAVAVVLRDLTLGNLRRTRRNRAERAHEQAAEDLAELRVRARDVNASRQALLAEMQEHQRLANELGDHEEARRAFDAYREAKDRHERADTEAWTLQAAVEKAQADEQRTLADCRAAATLSRSDRLWQILAGGLPMVLAYVLIGALGWGSVAFWPLIALALFALLTIAVAIAVVSMTQHFAWFALCVFVGVGLVIAASTYVRTDSTTKVSPVAVIADGLPVTGFFVAEAGDAVYVAQSSRKDAAGLVFDHAAATLMRLPKDHVTALAMGPVMDEPNAYRRALRLAIALCLRPKAAAVADAALIAPAAADGQRTGRGKRTTRRARALTCVAQDIATLQQELANA